jgi:hypothetical protein
MIPRDSERTEELPDDGPMTAAEIAERKAAWRKLNGHNAPAQSPVPVPVPVPVQSTGSQSRASPLLTCGSCNAEKSPSEFYPSDLGKGSEKRRPSCRTCRQKRNRFLRDSARQAAGIGTLIERAIYALPPDELRDLAKRFETLANVKDGTSYGEAK